MKKISILLLIANLSQNTYSNSFRPLIGLISSENPDAVRAQYGVHTVYIDQKGNIHTNGSANDPHRGKAAKKLKAKLAAKKL